MATAILDKILQSQFGRSFIFWVFLALVGGNIAQFVDRRRQDAKLAECNGERVKDQKHFSSEIERVLRESITLYQSMLQRLQTVEEKRKKR